jgi:hypothetical protein
MSGFHVILDDLTHAADTFHKEATTFQGAMSGSARPTPADTGDGSLNATLASVLDDIVFLHSSIAAWMHEDGDGLQRNRDNYQQVDQSMHELYDDLMGGT